VRQALEHVKALGDNVMRPLAADIDDEADPAAVVLEPRVVQSLFFLFPLISHLPTPLLSRHLVKKTGARLKGVEPKSPAPK
jgi:hypothetical protein